LRISRHRQQLEAAILQGKAHLPLAHLYVKPDYKRSRYGLEGEDLEPELIELEDNRDYMDEYFKEEVQESDYNKKTTSPPPLTTDSKSNNESSPLIKEEAKESPKESVKEEPIIKEEPQPESPPKEMPPSTPVILTNKIEGISREDMEKNRISLEEIKNQFPTYETGAPSKVLFVKNLDKHVIAEDLVSIFLQFQEEGKDKIGFKLMSGKMKGTAFITFHDESTATKALELANGYLYKNKPLVIQYGKSK